jgi:multiple sugar transport system substrate-binding protein
MMKIKIILSILVVTGLLIFSGCGCKDRNARKYSLKLEVWGMLDDNEALGVIFDNYKKINPNIAEIRYRKISTDTYKKELLEALASGLGPDIFMIHNDWVLNFRNKIVPAPKIPADGLITEQKFRQNFPDVAIFDFVKAGEIYAVPLSVDSLGLYYNKDIFNEAGIIAPPRTWNEFIEDVRKITRINSFGDITRAGAAIGTAYSQAGTYNINRATDILNLIMLQYNTQMSDSNGRITFDRTVSIDSESFSPGEAALNFYTQFAKSGSPNYTWNSRMHYSIDAFSEVRRR